MHDYFSDILDSDEEVKGAFKPVKRKFYLVAVTAYCVIGLLIVLFATLAIIFPTDRSNPPPAAYRFIPSAVFAAGLLINCILDFVWYKNACYCYTNKRIIIKCGVFGVYYRCLDLSSIGAIDVSITIFDKILRADTGTLRFGTIARPTVPNTGIYAFMHVKNPYETYRKIKDAIDEAKTATKKIPE